MQPSILAHFIIVFVSCLRSKKRKKERKGGNLLVDKWRGASAGGGRAGGGEEREKKWNSVAQRLVKNERCDVMWFRSDCLYYLCVISYVYTCQRLVIVNHIHL